jgi:hypothetical protein
MSAPSRNDETVDNEAIEAADIKTIILQLTRFTVAFWPALAEFPTLNRIPHRQKHCENF